VAVSSSQTCGSGTALAAGLLSSGVKFNLAPPPGACFIAITTQAFLDEKFGW
jgi:hypothetical protein